MHRRQIRTPFPRTSLLVLTVWHTGVDILRVLEQTRYSLRICLPYINFSWFTVSLLVSANIPSPGCASQREAVTAFAVGLCMRASTRSKYTFDLFAVSTARTRTGDYKVYVTMPVVVLLRGVMGNAATPNADILEKRSETGFSKRLE